MPLKYIDNMTLFNKPHTNTYYNYVCIYCTAADALALDYKYT